MFKVGQKVWDVLCGPGTVVEVIDYVCNYPVIVEFDGMGRKCYTKEGKSNKSLEKPSLYPYPVQIFKEVTKPSICWEHVQKDFKFLAQNSDGSAHLYWEKPVLRETSWQTTQGDCAEAHQFASYVPGTCDWQDSLVERP